VNKTESADSISVGLIGWLTFHAIALYSSASYWLRFKRVCAWHQPKPMRMGGNPFAKNVTHGICPECFVKQSAEILKHHKLIITQGTNMQKIH
jgi:hypothetical protein